MFLNRLRMLSSTNIFFSLLIFPSILILVVWGDGIEPSLCLLFRITLQVSSYASLPEFSTPARKSGDQFLFQTPTEVSADAIQSCCGLWPADTRMKERYVAQPFTHVLPPLCHLSFILICVARGGIEPPTARGFYSTRYPYTYRLAMIKQRISQ
jgi:hypothetical protein